MSSALISAPDFKKCLLASLALHAGFMLLRGFGPHGPQAVVPGEIDLTFPFVGNGPPKLAAPKRLIKGAVLPAAPVEQPLPPQPVKPPEPPKDWVMPGKETQKVIAPQPEVPPATKGGAENGTGISPILGGSGPGFPYGVPNGSMTPGAPAGVVRPKLLNRDEVLANLRKFYPERERYADHEGTVVVDIHLSAEGAITAVEVFQSASPLFDAAAIKVAHLMRYEPARTPQGPVAAKVRQTMQFKLQD